LNNYRIEKSRDGFDVLVIDDKYINSRFSPTSEANNIIHAGKNLICVFGLGLGYGLHNILKNNLESIIIVFEPVHEILLQYRQKYINNDLLKNRDVLFLNEISSDKIYSYIEDVGFFSDGRIYYYSNLGYKSLYPEKEVEFYTSVKESFNIITQNILTESNFIPIWTKNFIFNSSMFEKHPIINPIKHDQNDNIAIIVCAGPNLVYDLPIIKKYREKVTIFAVDTAIKPLVSYNINPDFVISLDGQFYSFEDFIKNPDEEIIFIFDVLSYPQAARLNKNIYFTITENIFKNSIIEYFSKKNNLEEFGIYTGGTVSDYTLSFALNLGFKNIYFSGLDLSFPDLLTHSKASPYYEKFMRLQNYFETPETNIIKAISKRKIKDSKSKIKDKKLLSDFVLENYALYIDNFVKINKLDNIYNSVYHGLQIDGLKNVDLEILLKDSISKRVLNKQLMKSSKDFYFSKENVNDLYSGLLNDLYNLSLEIKSIMESSDFETENFILLEHCKKKLDDSIKNFPFLNKFIIMTKIILDKKNITDKYLLYYKHIFYKMIQSIYYLIRTIQKSMKLLNFN